MFDLFLSHNSVDKPWTERLAAAVEADGSGPPLKVFFDQWDIPPGGDIPQALEEALEVSRHVGLVLSPEALASPWVSLERSSAIYSDPDARQRVLIPLLRRDCDMPRILRRLKYIDFRRDQDFDQSLHELVRVLRGTPSPRGASTTPEDLLFREDAALLSQYRRFFDRPAFRTPCARELSIDELSDAVDDTQAAINTGSLYSRRGNLLSTAPDRASFHTPEFIQAFDAIALLLTELKHAVASFQAQLAQVSPTDAHPYFFPMNAWSISDPLSQRTVMRQMNYIDEIRNYILCHVNVLLEKCGERPFPLLRLSCPIP